MNFTYLFRLEGERGVMCNTPLEDTVKLVYNLIFHSFLYKKFPYKTKWCFYANFFDELAWSRSFVCFALVHMTTCSICPATGVKWFFKTSFLKKEVTILIPNDNLNESIERAI